ILVFVILVLSIACTTWAVAVFSHSRGGDVKERKEFAKQVKDKYEAMKTERGRADELRKAAAEELAKLEKDRADNEAWYRDQLEIMKTGKDTKGQKAAASVQALARDAKGAVQVEANGRPRLQGPMPLDDYETTLQKIQNDRMKLQQERDK